MKSWRIFGVAILAAVALSIGPVGWGRICRMLMQRAVTEGWVDPANAYYLGLPLVTFPFFLLGTMAMAWLISQRNANNRK